MLSLTALPLNTTQIAALTTLALPADMVEADASIRSNGTLVIAVLTESSDLDISVDIDGTITTHVHAGQPGDSQC